MVMVENENDSNYTLVEPMENRSDEVMTSAYQTLLKTKTHVLDNECSTKLKELIRDTCKLELVPPGCHRRNIAEVAIKASPNNTSLESWQGSQTTSLGHCGTDYCHKPKPP